MSLLLIDAGNTRLKWAIHSGTEFKQQGHSTLSDFEKVLLLPEFKNIHELIYSSVINENQTNWMLSACLNVAPKLQYQRIQGNSGINHLPSRYTNPDQLGSDRRAMLLGAAHLFPNKNLMIIGSGTATTIDFLIEGHHIGGWITPGFHLMADSLGGHTANLPRIDESHIKNLSIAPGLTTEHGIAQGVLASQLGAISMARQYALNHHLNLDACVTSGGNALLLNNHLQAFLDLRILHEPNLVIQGLLAWKKMGFIK
jgi:type III pantothenate kinase